MELEASEVCGFIAREWIYFPSEIVRWVIMRRRRIRTAKRMRWWDRLRDSIMLAVLRRAHERWFWLGEGFE